jgi:hypothetical protein
MAFQIRNLWVISAGDRQITLEWASNRSAGNASAVCEPATLAVP